MSGETQAVTSSTAPAATPAQSDKTKAKQESKNLDYTVQKGDSLWNITKEAYGLENDADIFNQAKKVANEQNNLKGHSVKESRKNSAHYKAGAWNHIAPGQILHLKDVTNADALKGNSKAEGAGNVSDDEAAIDRQDALDEKIASEQANPSPEIKAEPVAQKPEAPKAQVPDSVEPKIDSKQVSTKVTAPITPAKQKVETETKASLIPTFTVGQPIALNNRAFVEGLRTQYTQQFTAEAIKNGEKLTPEVKEVIENKVNAKLKEQGYLIG